MLPTLHEMNQNVEFCFKKITLKTSRITKFLPKVKNINIPLITYASNALIIVFIAAFLFSPYVMSCRKR